MSATEGRKTNYCWLRLLGRKHSLVGIPALVGGALAALVCQGFLNGIPPQIPLFPPSSKGDSKSVNYFKHKLLVRSVGGQGSSRRLQCPLR